MLRGAHPLEVVIRVLFTSVGGLLAAFVIWMVVQNVTVIRTHEHAIAEVVKCERKGPVASKGLNHFYVQVRYDGPNGPRNVELERSTTNYDVGEVIDIYYLPETAYKAIGGDFMSMWWNVIFVAVPALVMLGVGLWPIKAK